VQRGQNRDALISWYFTLAHELAHNLESGHNSSHEFYFSSIAEEYLLAFGQLIADAQ
jgi:Zn-dependent peptidase ImmA (M78 family)